MLEEQVLLVVLAVVFLVAAIFKKSEGGALMAVSAAMTCMASFYTLINLTGQISSSNILAFSLLLSVNYWIVLLAPLATTWLWIIWIERLRVGHG